MAVLGLASVAVAVARFVAGPGPVQLAGMIGAVSGWMFLFSYLASPFLVMGLPVRYAIALLHAPYYVAWKATIGRSKRPDGWIRTPREAASVEQN